MATLTSGKMGERQGVGNKGNGVRRYTADRWCGIGTQPEQRHRCRNGQDLERSSGSNCLAGRGELDGGTFQADPGQTPWPSYRSEALPYG